MNNYPNLRVVLVFSLAPILGGLIMAAILLFIESTGPEMEEDIWSLFGFHFSLFSLLIVFSLISEVIPAFFLGVVFMMFELRRKFAALLVVSFVGGVVAFLWTGLIFGFWSDRFRYYGDTFGNPLMQNLPAKSIILGGVCSLFAAICSFPPSPPPSKKMRCMGGFG